MKPLFSSSSSTSSITFFESDGSSQSSTQYKIWRGSHVIRVISMTFAKNTESM